MPQFVLFWSCAILSCGFIEIRGAERVWSDVAFGYSIVPS